MKKYFVLVLFIILCFNSLTPKLISAQTKIGVSIETLGYIAKIENKFLDSQTSNESSFENDYGFSIPFTFKIASNYSFSLRPGFFLGNLYIGPHITALAKYDLENKMYLLSGINVHFNLFNGGNTRHGYSVTLPTVVLGAGYDLPFGFVELQFNYSLNNVNYGYQRKPTGHSAFYDSYYKTSWLIKLSFCYEWEL